MKKLFFALTTSALVTLSADPSNNLLTEVKFSYFYFQSKDLRDTYGNGGIDYQLAFSYFLKEYVALKIASDFFFKEGKSSTGDSTRIRIYPVSLGSFYNYNFGRQSLYAGGGLRYYFVDIRNDSPYVSPHSRGDGMGIYLDSGYKFTLDGWLVFDLFANYGFKKLSLHNDRPVQNVSSSPITVSGLYVGGGIGFKF